jgi:hypothetical protein
VLVFDLLKSADSSPNNTPDATFVFFVKIEPAVSDRLDRRCYRKLRKAIHSLADSSRYVILEVEIFDFAANAYSMPAGIERLDHGNSAFAFAHRIEQ